MTGIESSQPREPSGALSDERTTRATIADHLVRVDHIAVAVDNLAAAETWYSEVLGFRCVERRVLEGRRTGMISAVMEAGPITFVLIQGTNRDSQVSRFIQQYGQGVQHVALQVRGIDSLIADLKRRDLAFSTTIVNSAGLRQVFTKRSRETGLMFEIVERGKFPGFSDENVKVLFTQLEESDEF